MKTSEALNQPLGPVPSPYTEERRTAKLTRLVCITTLRGAIKEKIMKMYDLIYKGTYAEVEGEDRRSLNIKSAMR
jgi:hypothetical protein